MDRATLVTTFLCAATAVAYADEIGLGLKAAWRWIRSKRSAELPSAVLEMAAAELSSPDTERAERAAAIFRAHAGPAATAKLIPLLAHADANVTGRVARLLKERHDPEAAEALYWFHARRPA
jgi:HEAT repeat protein